MSKTNSDRSLHFIVRDDGYTQSIGYRHYLQAGLEYMNRRSPKDVPALLADATEGLRNHKYGAEMLILPDYEKMATGLPTAAKHHPQVKAFCTHAEKMAPVIGAFTCTYDNHKKRMELWNEAIKFGEPVLGPAATIGYGYAQHTNYMLKENGPTGGAPMITGISYEDKRGRGYWRTLIKHYKIDPDKPLETPITHAYKIPRSEEMLPLMKIVSRESCREEMLKMVKNLGFIAKLRATDSIELQIKHILGEKDPAFIHPICDWDYEYKLQKCLNPLFNALITPPKAKPPRGTAPPQEKMDAVATIYWLLAQTTPVVRGGSAYANIVLEHMAHRLRQQGYDYDVPFTKAGVDLWAEAAVLPLEDQGKLKGFKNQFKAGVFFDQSVTPDMVEDYIRMRLEAQQGAKAGLEALDRQAEPPTRC